MRRGEMEKMSFTLWIELFSHEKLIEKIWINFSFQID